MGAKAVPGSRHQPARRRENFGGAKGGSKAGSSSDVAHGSISKGRVLVLNATYEPLNVCTVRRAMILVLKEKAEILEAGEGELRSEHITLDRPDVIRLVGYVRIPHHAVRRRITRKAVLARDGWTCQYCGTDRPLLTVDHVIPRSRGGESVWENIVAACAPCNRKKGNRLPKEIAMHPRTRPRAPGPNVFIRVAAPVPPLTWAQYLPGEAPAAA